MSQNPIRRLRNTPRRVSRFSTTQNTQSRPSPSPVSAPSRKRADRRRPIDVLSDSDASAYETDGGNEPSGGHQSRGGTQETRRRAPKRSRVAEFDYGWVNYDKIPGYCIEKSPCNPDDILVQCEACSSWLHGSCLEEDAVREAYKSHDIPFPEDQPKARGRPPKKGAKKRKSDLTAFSASIKNTTSGKTRLTVTDQRPDKGDHWNVAVKCLLCKATIEEALNEEETKPREPTPLFENQQQDVDATQDNIILGARPNDDDEDSVLGKSQEEPQESAAAPARDRTALNSAKDAPPKKENDWLSKMLQ